MASNNMSPLRNFLNTIKNSVYNISSIDGIGNTDINAGSLFNGFSNLYRIGSLNYTNYITNMSYMFYHCDILTSIPNFDTSNVTDMSYMFYRCYNLTNISSFNTSNVTNMSYMFYRCYNLTTISNFDTSNVTNMSNMFYYCDNLIDIPLFNMSKVTSMTNTFYYCNNLSQASVNNIVASCATASKVTNKNWTNIGLDITVGSILNIWICTAPDYMNAVNIGWQNIEEI